MRVFGSKNNINHDVLACMYVAIVTEQYVSCGGTV